MLLNCINIYVYSFSQNKPKGEIVNSLNYVIGIYVWLNYCSSNMHNRMYKLAKKIRYNKISYGLLEHVVLNSFNKLEQHVE